MLPRAALADKYAEAGSKVPSPLVNEYRKVRVVRRQMC
jgi:hypothetical protein